MDPERMEKTLPKLTAGLPLQRMPLRKRRMPGQPRKRKKQRPQRSVGPELRLLPPAARTRKPERRTLKLMPKKRTPKLMPKRRPPSPPQEAGPALQRMLLQIKGIDHVVLITDSTMVSEASPEHLAHIADLNFDHNGDLSGSRLTMDRACQNIRKHTGCSIVDAFTMASLNPAKVIGLDREIGSIEEGKLADLVFIDDQFNVLRVMSEGEFYE
jgi:hypothetical protein